MRRIPWIALLLGLGGAGLLWYAIVTPGHSWSGPLPPLSDDDRVLAGRLRRHVEAVAAREHNLSHLAAYEAVARHIERSLGELGYPVERQPLDAVQGRIGNLAAEIRGSARTPGTVIVGAHYDSVAGSPGANDNGSGVAATLELARMLRDWTPAHTWRFVLFANEEPPYFKSEAMGSVAYVARLRARGERVVAMYSLETIGYYADEPGSQRYPFPLGLFYPSRGDFLAFVANLGSRDLLHRTIAAFRAHAQFPSEGLAAPALVPGVDWSDHWAFWRAGWPAVMITDTAPYRYPHYHTARDTPDQVDYPRLARVTGGLAATFRALDGRW